MENLESDENDKLKHPLSVNPADFKSLANSVNHWEGDNLDVYRSEMEKLKHLTEDALKSIPGANSTLASAPKEDKNLQ